MANPGAIDRLVQILALAFLWLVVSFSSPARADAEEAILEAEIRALDEAFQQLSDDYHRHKFHQAEIIDDIDVLSSTFKRLAADQQSVEAHQLVFTNLPILADNLDHPEIAHLVDGLLNNNQHQLAETIYGLVEDSGDQISQSSLNFVFAKFFAQNRQWQQVIQIIKDSFADLAGNDIDYAYLLQGSSLQHLKQHRQSVESYAYIPSTSPYYIHAQLNTALANIRQGWITEARSIIKSLLSKKTEKTDELTNRIYLILGYALLQKEYDRDARKAFRQISLDSRYANRALIAISLAAISQDDFIGALSTATALKLRQGKDLSSDEAYLVIPYIYEKLDQPLSIASSFSESIDHYQRRLLRLNMVRNQSFNFDQLQLDAVNGDLVLGENRFDFSRQYPGYVLQNRQYLARLLASSVDKNLTTELEVLIRKYDKVLHTIILNLVDQRIQIITSYLNQSRFGLARHYDSQQPGTEQ